MRLTSRDAIATVLVAVAIGATLSLVYGWNWPLIGDARAGAIALFVLSYPSCLIAQAPKRMQAAIEGKTRWSPYAVLSTVLGSATALLILLAAIINSLPVLVAATAVMAMIWVVTTVDRVTERGQPVLAAS